ncbi:hypothetical protein HHL28_14170 [Aerophototrophica crusticola]|uniref:Uncharacterized protein n=1 Tax=Aerophototrophica crusticola TaxID=1709002 RepID=A0A858RA82_9PROT|nr:hypothetical protein HHL28_14170 [Rhodospirillaceae bacterium B3]
MSDQQNSAAEQLFEKALDIAEKHLEMAMKEGGTLNVEGSPFSGYVAIAMIEAAVNQAVEVAGHEDIADMLRDLAEQIEADAEDEE